MAENYADNSTELQSCLRGLNTEFIEPSIGGDVIKEHQKFFLTAEILISLTLIEYPPRLLVKEEQK